MDIHSLPKNNALSPGAQLWIMADLSHSQWSQQIDWYIQFQMVEVLRRSKKTFSKELSSLLNETSSDYYEINVSKTAPLLLATENYLPNKKILQVSLTKDNPSWIKKCHQLWLKLGSPSVRFFLPDSFHHKELYQFWPTADMKNLSFVSGRP